MRRVPPVVLAGVACFLLTGSALAQDFPRFTNHVVDAAGVVPDEDEQRLNAELADYQKRSTNQIAIAVVESLDDTSIEDYSEDLFDEWGVGEKDKDNGLLLVVAMQERELRIEVGYGLEGELTDLESGRIVDAMAPLMRRGDIGGALQQAANGMRAALGDTQAPALAEPAEDEASETSFAWVIPIIVVIALMLFNRRRGRRRRDFGLWPIFLGGNWGGGSSGGFGGGGFGGGGFGGGGGGGSGGGGASGGW